MYEDLALFIDFENIRYSMLNIQRREPDPQELIAIARRYGTVMVARAYADWSRQPESFKGSLTAAMIDRADCPAKQRNRIRPGGGHGGNPPTGPLGSPYASDQPTGSYPRVWNSSTGALPAFSAQANENSTQEQTAQPFLDDAAQPSFDVEERGGSEQRGFSNFQREPYQSSHTGPLSSHTGPLSSSTGNTDSMPAINGGSSVTVQSTVDQNMLMDIIETVFDRPSISTFVLMTGDKDFTRISARLKLRLNKTVIIVGIPGTVSRDLISSASQFVPLVPHGVTTPAFDPTGPLLSSGDERAEFARSGNATTLPATPYAAPTSQYSPSYDMMPPSLLSPFDPDLLQFLDYIDRNWPWRTISSISHFLGDPNNPKNRFRGRLNRDSARDLLSECIQQGVIVLHTDMMGAQEVRLNRGHPEVAEVLKRF